MSDNSDVNEASANFLPKNEFSCLLLLPLLITKLAKMTMMEFFGCSFIAFGPPLAMFIFTIAKDPLRVIVLIASGFFWLLSLLLSSILWFALKQIWSGKQLRYSLILGLVFSVFFQELFRYFFYKMLRKADEGLQRVSQQGQNSNILPKDITNKNIMAYVSGLGFGIICGAFSLVNVLADMIGPGTVGIKGDSQYFFLASAFLTLAYVFLHTFWGVICFMAWDKKRYLFVVIVVASHMFTSSLTYLNGLNPAEAQQNYLATIITAYVVMIMMGCLAFKVSGGSIQSMKLALRCSKDRHETD